MVLILTFLVSSQTQPHTSLRGHEIDVEGGEEACGVGRKDREKETVRQRDRET